MRPDSENSRFSQAANWLMLIAPIVLLLPVGSPFFLFSDVGNWMPAWVVQAAAAATLLFLPVLILLIPLVVLFSGAFIYEAVRDWLDRGRAGGSLGIAVLWAGTALIYGVLLIKLGLTFVWP